MFDIIKIFCLNRTFFVKKNHRKLYFSMIISYFDINSFNHAVLDSYSCA